MIEVICPVCHVIRTVSAKKPWMSGNQPYSKICKKCCQVGKPKTQDCKDKLSKAVKQLQTPELLAKKSEFMLAHPEYWVNPCSDLGHQAWAGKHHSQESKEKISEGVKKAKGMKK
jgi:hypothetical protein